MKIAVIVVELSPGIHRAHCPSLPGCTVLARSRQEAAERISGAVVGYLASFDAAPPERIQLEILESRNRPSEPARDAIPAGAR